MRKVMSCLVCLIVMAIILCYSADGACTTVSGQFSIPSSDMGYKPYVYGMKVRVQGTEISADVTAVGSNKYNGEFTLDDVPNGTVTLLLIEEDQDVFTQASKRVQVNVAGETVTGVSFDLVYHWKELVGYPSSWGQTGYVNEWTPHFVSDQVGFILFRVRGTGIDPERVELYRTLNGGETWAEIGHWVYGDAPYPDFTGRKFYFSDENHGVIQALVDVNASPDVVWYHRQGVLYTADGGSTWGYREFPNPPEATASDIIDIYRFSKISDGHWIACGQNAGTSSYGLPGYAVIWETADYGNQWEVKTYWQEDYSECTGLGSNENGKAIAFFTPWAWGGLKYLALRDESGAWSINTGNSLITNSGIHGPADLPMIGDTAWVSNDSHSTLPAGLYRSEDAGLIWAKISDGLLQYMDFASQDKGFALAGGPVYVSYDGGESWLYQSAGAGASGHGNDIWAFDTTHAIWHEAGAGDANGVAQIFSFVEPWEANFEILPEVTIKNGYVKGGDTDVPMASYKLFNHGPVPIRITQLTLRASGSGNDAQEITAVSLWMDQNANGYVDSEDLFLAQGAYSAHNGTLSLPVSNLVLEQFIPQYLLVTYDFASELSPGKNFTLHLYVRDVGAEATDTGGPIAPSAPPSFHLAGSTVTAAAEIFGDRFESGLGNWMAEDPDPGYEWQITDTAFVSSSHSVRVGENPGHEGWTTNNILTLSQPLDFSVDGSYYLTFYHKYTLPQGYVAWVEVSTDGGIGWTPVTQYGSHPMWGYYALDDFVFESVDLSTYAGAEGLLLRFRFDTTSATTTPGEWSLDDVRLSFIAFPPRVALLSPNGGEMIPSGSTYTIEWEAPPEVETFNLLYSLDNGATWTLIKKGISESTCSWDVPDVKGNKTKCLIKVVGFTASGAKAGADISDGNFTIEVVTLLSPNGEEIFHPGDTTTIRWNACAAAVRFDVLFSMDNGTTWKNVENGDTPVVIATEELAGTALPVRFLPPSTGNKTKCLMKVVAYNDRNVKIGEDKSDSPFVIEVIKLDSPDGDTPVKGGVETSITWTMYDTAQPVTKILLYFTKDGGNTWKLTDTLTGIFSPGPGSHPWLVPSMVKPRCKMKIVLKDEGGATRGQDISDAFFAIEP